MDVLAPSDPARVGPYTLLGRLGAGTMGAVFLGRSTGGRTVAVKLIRPDLAGDPGFRARFRAEVAAARAVSGAFTAPVVDADPDAPVPWMATAFVPGISLHDAVAVAGPLPEPALRALTAGIAEALVSVHASGLTHRDLKPANVLLALDGPHVIDFGIARAAEGTALTATGRRLGTPAYMSPEQVMGHPLTPASDVFALGSTIAFAAKGSSLFGDGPEPEVLRRVVRDEPDLTAVPEGLRLTVAACLAKSPEERPAPREVVEFIRRGTGPATAGAWPPAVLMDAIEEAADVMAPGVRAAPAQPPPLPAGGPPPASPSDAVPAGSSSPPPPAARPLARRKLLLGMAGGALALAGGGTALTLALRDPSTKGAGGAKPAVNLEDPARSLDPKVVATPSWTAPLSEALIQVAGDKDTVVAVGSDHVRGFDRTSGRALWGPLGNTADTQYAGTGGDCVAVGNGMAFALGVVRSADKITMTRRLKAIDLATGKVAWTVAAPNTGFQETSVPGILDGLVYVTGTLVGRGGLDFTSGPFIWAVDPATRKIRWEKVIVEDYQDGRSTKARLMLPATGTRLLWATSNSDGSSPKISGLDVNAGGKVRWSQPAPGGNQTIATSFAALRGNWQDAEHCWAGGFFLYLVDRLHAVDPANGQVAWSTPTDAKVTFTAVVADQDGSTVYAAGADYQGHVVVYAFDAGTGAVRWAGSLAFAPSNVGLIAMRCADGHVYVWARGKVWALATADGTGRWTYEFNGSGNAPYAVAIPFWAGGGRVYGTTDKGLVAISATGDKGSAAAGA
ncbi:PQQ-binding-like beta-propeller repeat protein [Streptomyces sp. NPDC051315]|uniref:protein kinase domain-containing protein n=1 Tax=Streptomyces sp. NPDC051315 TaxID=3365650 RepID=UPI0037BB554B